MTASEGGWPERLEYASHESSGWKDTLCDALEPPCKSLELLPRGEFLCHPLLAFLEGVGEFFLGDNHSHMIC